MRLLLAAVVVLTGALAAAQTWTPLGPAPEISDASHAGTQDYGLVVGRVTSIAIDPTDITSNTVYVGTSGAGVWRSWNAAAADPASVTWERLTDDNTWPAIGALAIQPGNNSVLLAGTGEGNNSADSLYGFGILRSTDRGATWTLVSTADNGTRSFRGLAVAHLAFSTDNPQLVLAATVSSFGELNGADGSNVTHGLYYSTDAGASWHFANIASITAPGPPDVTSVVYNASAHLFFAAVRRHGFYSSPDGVNWTRLTTQPGNLGLFMCPNSSHSTFCPLIRGEISVRPGSNEMYAWYINATSLTNMPSQGIYKTLNSGGTWTALATTAVDSCGEPGCGAASGAYAYNLSLAAIPNGTATDLYAGAVNLFKCSVSPTNAACSTLPFMNLTHVYGCSPLAAPAHVFPAFHDVQALAANPSVIYFATDGGVYRTLNSAGLNSASCSAHLPFDNLNLNLGGLDDIVSIAPHPTDPDTLLAATRDNFAAAVSPALSNPNGTTWTAMSAGTNPFAGYVAIDPTASSTWFTSRSGDVGIQRCTLGAGCRSTDFSNVITTTTVGGDHGGFYVPYIFDPGKPSNLIVGTCRVWRGPSNGSGWSASNALSNSFQPGGTVPCSGSETQLITQLAAGGPVATNGSQVIYAGTAADNFNTNSGGRIWVTTNAAGGAATWVDRTGTINPHLYNYSAIVVDPTDATGQTAYVAFRGYTGGGGRIWKTTNAGVNWSDVSTALTDLPVNGLVIDPIDHNILYAATDGGVFMSPNQGGTWTLYGSGMPLMPVVTLAAQTAGGVNQLLAGTHATGVWTTDLHKNADYAIATQAPNSVAVQQTINAHYTVVLSTADGFNQPVTLSCSGLPTGASCGFSQNPVTPSALGASVTVTVSTALSSTSGDYVFSIQGSGGGVSHSATPAPELVLSVFPDFALQTSPTLVAVAPGQTAQYPITVVKNGSFSSQVALSCAGAMPAGASCSVSPATVDLSSASQPATVSVTTTAGTTPVGDTNFTLHGAQVGGSDTHDLGLTLRVNDFTVGSSSSAQNIQQGGSANYTVTVTGQNGWSAPVTLSCASFTSAGVSCAFSQNNFVPAAGGTSVTVTVSAAANAAVASGQTFNVVASDGTTSRSVSLGYSTILVQDFQFALDSNATQTITKGAQAGWGAHLLPLNSFSASITLTCSITGAPAGATCAATPSPVSIGGGVQQAESITITTTTATPAGNYAVTVTAAGGGKTHAINLTLVVQGATLSISPSSRTIAPGAGTTYTITATGQNGFTSSLMLGCPSAPPGVTCSFNPPMVTPGAGSSTMTVLTASNITTGTKTIAVAGNLLGVPTVATSNASLVVSTTAASFTLANSTSTKTINVGGGSASYTLSVRSTTSTSPGAVTMSCAPPLPAGMTCSFNPASFTPTTTARSVTATVTTTAAVLTGSYPLTFQAATTTQLRQATGTLNVADFALVVSPDTQQVASTAGGSVQYDVALTAIAGFSASVPLSCTGLPAGTTCSFSPSSVTPTAAGAHSTLTVTTTASTPGGTNNFIVQGTSGALTHSQQVAVIVDPRDFTLSPSPTSVSVLAGGSNTTTISTSVLGGLTGNVGLACTNIAPATANLTCSFNPVTVAAGSSSVLTLTGAAGLAGGTYTVTVQGSMSSPVSRTHTTTVTVTVPDFGLGASPGSQTVTPGSTANYTVTTSALNGFSGSVGLSCAVLTAPAGTACAVDLASVAAGSGTAMHVTTSSGTPTGTYTVRLTGTSGTTTHTFDVQVTVGAAVDFTLTTSTPTRTVNRGTSTYYSLTVKAVGGFTEAVSIACGSGKPVGVTCGSVAAFVPSSLGTTKSLGLFAGSTAVPGTYTFQIVATSATKQHAISVQLTIQ